jgi:hypothetical protein
MWRFPVCQHNTNTEWPDFFCGCNVKQNIINVDALFKKEQLFFRNYQPINFGSRDIIFDIFLICLCRKNIAKLGGKTITLNCSTCTIPDRINYIFDISLYGANSKFRFNVVGLDKKLVSAWWKNRGKEYIDR